jgi:4-hydroxy-tetrahydrodipicolinate synthase
MQQNTRQFQGLFVPHVTPFDDSGAVDLGSLERLTAHLAGRRGVSGLVSCARIGEGPLLTNEEKRSVYRVAGNVARQAGRTHIAAISPQSTQEAVALLREIEHLPVDAVMIFPPLLFAWGKVDGELKVRFFKDLAAASEMPLVLFQVPVASYWYDPETVCRIAESERVVAFKEASFSVDLFTDTVRRLSESGATMQVLTGNDRFVAESYRLGANGALIGVSNLATEKWGALDEAGRAGEHSEAMALQEELAELKELVFSEPIVEAVSRIKTILRHEGLIKSAVVRKPQLGVSREEQSKLLRIYQSIAPNLAEQTKRAAG